MPVTEAAPLETKRIEYALLVAAGPLVGAEPLLQERLATADLIVGIDGGAAILKALGITPHIVTGDFDSLPSEILDDLAARGTIIVPTPDQNYTDLDKALAHVLYQYEARQIDIFGATGGRLDHIYSALSAIVKYGRLGKSQIRLVDSIGVTWLLPGTETITGHDLPGRTLSLMAMGRVSGISTTGLRWQLSNECLAPGLRDGTSNQIVSQTVTVRAESGNLLVMLHHAVPKEIFQGNQR